MQMYFFVVTSKTLCPSKKKGKKRNIKGTIEALLGCKRSWKSNLVLFCGFRLFAECVFEMLLCVDVRLLSFEVKCVCWWGSGVCELSECLFGPGLRKGPLWHGGWSGMHLLRRVSKATEQQAHGRNVGVTILSDTHPFLSRLTLLPSLYTIFSLLYSFFLISNPVEDVPMLRTWETHTVPPGWLLLFDHVTAEYIATPFAIAKLV